MASIPLRYPVRGGQRVRSGVRKDAALYDDPRNNPSSFLAAMLIPIRSGPIVTIDGRSITDWESFHDVFARTFGLPDFHGRNLNAWVDCMTDLDQNTGMTAIHVDIGQCLTLQIEHVGAFRANAAEIFEALIDCCAFVNWRRMEQGAPAVIALSYWR